MINNYPKINSVNKVSDDKVTIDILVTPECDFFKGHFDDHAVLPGIGQIDFAIKMINEHFGLDSHDMISIPQAKFKKVIVPNDNLELKISKNPKDISFEYLLNGEQVSVGKLKYV